MAALCNKQHGRFYNPDWFLFFSVPRICVCLAGYLVSYISSSCWSIHKPVNLFHMIRCGKPSFHGMTTSCGKHIGKLIVNSLITYANSSFPPSSGQKLPVGLDIRRLCYTQTIWVSQYIAKLWGSKFRVPPAGHVCSVYSTGPNTERLSVPSTLSPYFWQPRLHWDRHAINLL